MKRILLAALAASIPLSSLGQDATLLSVETAAIFGDHRQPGDRPRAALQLLHWEVQRTLELTDVRRGYVRFEVPEGETIRSARLKLPLYTGTGDTPATLAFFDVQAWDLRTFYEFTGGEERWDLWRDAGSGKLFGFLDVAWEPEYLRVDLIESPDAMYAVDLLPAAVHSLNAARGDSWSVGTRFVDDHLAEASTRIRSHYPWPGVIGGPPPTPCEGASCYFQLELTYGPPPPLGDFSASGAVEQGDLDFALLNWGITTQSELDAVLLGWGEGAQVPLAAAAVPEPSAILLALGIAVGLPPLRLLAAKSVQVRRA